MVVCLSIRPDLKKKIVRLRNIFQKFQYYLSSGDTKGMGEGSSGESKKTNVDDFNAETATTKQKGNFGEIKSSDNLLNNQSIKAAGYDLKVIGRDAPSIIDDIKGIDGLYENTNVKSNIKYVIDESLRFLLKTVGKLYKQGDF